MTEAEVAQVFFERGSAAKSIEMARYWHAYGGPPEVTDCQRLLNKLLTRQGWGRRLVDGVWYRVPPIAGVVTENDYFLAARELAHQQLGDTQTRERFVRIGNSISDFKRMTGREPSQSELNRLLTT